MKVITFNQKAENVPACFGVSQERADELAKKVTKHCFSSSSKSEVVERSIEEAETMEEAFYATYYAGSFLNRIKNPMEDLLMMAGMGMGEEEKEEK